MRDEWVGAIVIVVLIIAGTLLGLMLRRGESRTVGGRGRRISLWRYVLFVAAGISAGLIVAVTGPPILTPLVGAGFLYLAFRRAKRKE